MLGLALSVGGRAERGPFLRLGTIFFPQPRTTSRPGSCYDRGGETDAHTYPASSRICTLRGRRHRADRCAGSFSKRRPTPRHTAPRYAVPRCATSRRAAPALQRFSRKRHAPLGRHGAATGSEPTARCLRCRRRVPRRFYPSAQRPHVVQRRRAPEGMAFARDYQPLSRYWPIRLETPQRAARGTPRSPCHRSARPAWLRYLGRHRHAPARPACCGAPALRGRLLHRRGGKPRGLPSLHGPHASASRAQAPESRARNRGSRRLSYTQHVRRRPARFPASRNQRHPAFRKGGRP